MREAEHSVNDARTPELAISWSKQFKARSITRGGVLLPVCALAGIERWRG